MEKVTINIDSSANVELDYRKIQTSALTLRALNHKLRRQIIEMLNEHSPMVVTDIYVKLRIEQSVASQHLAILRKADIVTTTRNGKYIEYGLNVERLKDISKFVDLITN